MAQLLVLLETGTSIGTHQSIPQVSIKYLQNKMVALTKAQARAALQHVLDTLFEVSADCAMVESFTKDGVNDIRDVLAMDYEHFTMLTYVDDNGDTVAIPVWQQALLKILKSFHWWRSTGNQGPIDDWTLITKEMFDDFCLGPDYQHSPNQATQIISSPIATSTTPAFVRPKDPIGEFKKGIKRDPSLFVVYKDEKQWDKWQRSTISLARAQGVEEVLDSLYAPTDQDDILLFEEKKKFMYAVFECTLQTDQGKSCVSEWDSTFDSQRVYADLLNYSIKSTKASLDSGKLLQYITSAKIGDGTWKGTAQSFVLHWQDQVRLYDKIVAPTERLSDTTKNVMLETAVHSIEMLRAVRFKQIK